MNIEGGVIKEISIYGDLFGEKDIKDLEPKLIGIRHDIEALKIALNEVNIDNYIKGLTNNEFIQGIMNVGRLLHSFIITTVENPEFMFGRNIMPFSFVLSGAITIVFSLIVNLFMNKKLKNIKMVDSMKAID